MKDDNATADIPSALGMENFLASSVHDMKNSVSMLICGLEKALASADSSKLSTYTELVQMNHEAKRINSNLVQLLTLYKLGQKIYPFDPQYICVSEFSQLMVMQYMALLKSHGIRLEIDVDPDLHWYFDEDLVGGVIGNALNNALRYARNRINIIARESEGMLELRIDDDGTGYSDLILQEGANCMRSVDFQGGSTGLGLYFSTMVARIHQNHNQSGELKLENGGSLSGACFVLLLP